MQSAKRPFLSSTVAATILVGSLVVAPFSMSANAAQGNKSLIIRPGTLTTTRYAHVAFSIRLEDQLLATLRYLPVTFVPGASTPTTTTTTTSPSTSTTTSTTTTTTIPSTSTTTPASTTTSVPATTTTKPKPND